MSLFHADAAVDVGASTTDVAVVSGGGLRGLVRLHGQRFGVGLEVADDACRLTLSLWGSPGEITWLRVWRGTGPGARPAGSLSARSRSRTLRQPRPARFRAVRPGAPLPA